MNSSENLRAKALEVTDAELIVELEDGSRHSTPISTFPVLMDATPKERTNWEFIGGGRGIHWPDIDEHISTFSIVHPEQTMAMRPEAVESHLCRNRERRTRHSMKDLFPGYYPPSDDDFLRLWNDGLVAFDANVLLDMFRYSPETSESILDVIRSLEDRVWLPYHAALEYHRNLPSVIANQAKSYKSASNDLSDLLEEFTEQRGHPCVDPGLLEQLEELASKMKAALQQRRSDTLQLLHDNPLKEKIAGVFQGKIGDKPAEGEIENIYRAGEKRYEKNVPPGYKDRKKEPRERKYGDLLIWCEILSKAEADATPVIFVTSDQKEDWVLSKSGRTLGPQPELVQEFHNRCAQPFHLYTTQRFLEQAGERLQMDLEETAVEEVTSVATRREPHVGWATFSAAQKSLNDVLASSVAAREMARSQEKLQNISKGMDALGELMRRQKELEQLTRMSASLPQVWQLQENFKQLMAPLDLTSQDIESGDEEREPVDEDHLENEE